MLKDVTIGQYYPTNSIIHRLDPRTKIHFTLLYIVALFLVDNMIGYGVAFATLITITLISKIPVNYVLRGVKGLVFIIMITVAINLFMTPGTVRYQFWIFKITEEGLKVAVFMALRLIFLVTGTSLMTLTTSPISLTDGIEYSLKGVPGVRKYAHELAMMMTIALRFIPTLMEETDRIMKAQKARGADLDSGNLIQRAKSLIPILVPLFVSAFRRADELAIAMEARCYRGGENRTRLHALKFGRIDIYAYATTFLMIGAVILTRWI
ncbi:energy-coupling factor transporter transmembrane component T family protein [Alkalibacter mobilis]|uniref:energy-coupling factor transporter transmembrane component T family protein n=1 Tax=Alkalibacter mobilis TaxID=2787712 RepID=UPI00189EC006|nr:energy-coupling factor transporter transmembrane component T [Alkalibacter mobilis]MBF7095959.1 energy-coupling factor transporter transmembrane protein EcfT [Alkalibacter mobilis]